MRHGDAREETAPDDAAVPAARHDDIRLIVPAVLSEKMDRALIAGADARRAVAWCETTGIKLLDSGTGVFVGHRRIGALTYWVHYKPEGDRLRLENIYCHRAALEEDASLTTDPSSKNPSSKIICLKCNIPLADQKVRFTYLNFPFWATLPTCPVCRQAYLPEDFAGDKLAEVEQTLEDK